MEQVAISHGSKNTVLVLDGNHLRLAYSVYIIQLVNGNESYFYVGQTGDSHFITARSPLGRIGGHLQARNRSKQNQLYRYIAEVILKYPARDKYSDYTIAEKAAINDFLSRSTVNMYSYPVIDFDYHASKEEHQIQRQKVLEFEKEVINLFKEGKKHLINKSSP